jgi:PAS domain S-box-containing protein
VARGIHPTTIERPFGVHEIFFSTTDRKGVIRSGNSVFTRVSGYTTDELIGKPHTLVRHPDMPRVVFQLLWDEIGAGRTVAAYVKNQASDGSYYWVLATVVPIEDGYLSVRVKPTSPLLATVIPLYEELRALEQGIEDSGGTPTDAMAASAPRLLERLHELGLADYEAFMRLALPLEMRHFVQARGAVRERDASSDALGAALAACTQLRIRLSREFSRMGRYDDLEAAFEGKAESVLRLADEIRLFSLNAQIGSARLRETGAALSVIADIMRTRSEAVAGSVREIGGAIEGATDILSSLAFEVALATLQCETAFQFMVGVERADVEMDAAVLAANVRALATCLESGLAPLGPRLASLQGHLSRVGNGVAGLRDELGRLVMLQVAGGVEIARLPEATALGMLFQEIRSQVEHAKTEIAGLGIIDELRRAGASGLTVDLIERNLRSVTEWATAIAWTESRRAA